MIESPRAAYVVLAILTAGLSATAYAVRRPTTANSQTMLTATPTHPPGLPTPTPNTDTVIYWRFEGHVTSPVARGPLRSVRITLDAPPGIPAAGRPYGCDPPVYTDAEGRFALACHYFFALSSVRISAHRSDHIAVERFITFARWDLEPIKLLMWPVHEPTLHLPWLRISRGPGGPLVTP